MERRAGADTDWLGGMTGIERSLGGGVTVAADLSLLVEVISLTHTLSLPFYPSIYAPSLQRTYPIFNTCHLEHQMLRYIFKQARHSHGHTSHGQAKPSQAKLPLTLSTPSPPLSPLLSSSSPSLLTHTLSLLTHRGMIPLSCAR